MVAHCITFCTHQGSTLAHFVYKTGFSSLKQDFSQWLALSELLF